MFANLLLKPFKFLSNHNSLTNTIYALSSGLNTAITIVRISGPQATRALNLISKKNAQKIISNPRYLQFTKIYNSQKQIIDQGMIVYFPSKISYNNQDIVELHLHGSKAVVEAVFKQLKYMKMRMAERGQITKRAVVNGKLNLNQAEAINDLIKSETQFTRQVSINNLLGKNMNYIEALREDLVKSLAKSQAYIDFNQDQSDVKQTLFDDTQVWVKDNIIPKIQKLLKNYKNLKILKDGVNVVIVGKPNVGKSTLINLMANKNVSIVNAKAGTTRDIIETSVELQGYRLNLIDTAGLRNSDCDIQNQGVKKAKEKIIQSHIKLLLFDLSQQKTEFDQKNKKLTIYVDDSDPHINQLFKDEHSIIVINKIDLLSLKIPALKIVVSSFYNSQWHYRKPTIIMSAGVEKDPTEVFNFLSQKLKQQYSFFIDSNQIFFTRQRYFSHLESCLEMLELYIAERQVDFACQYLRQAINEVQQIFGRVDCQDVLDVLFQDFCIGK